MHCEKNMRKRQVTQYSQYSIFFHISYAIFLGFIGSRTVLLIAMPKLKTATAVFVFEYHTFTDKKLQLSEFAAAIELKWISKP